jgi:hypothetical protein
MLPIANYRARAIEGQMGFADTGTEQIAVTFEIIEEGDFEGHTITWFGFLTEATTERTIKTLIVCGWEGDDLSDLRGLDRNEVELVIEHETYNGVKRARVKWVNRPGSGAFVMKRPMTDIQKRALAQKMRGLIVTLRKQEGAPRSPQSPPPPAQGRRRTQDDPGGYPPDWDQQPPPDLGGL